jgi:hypothetical protein
MSEKMLCLILRNTKGCKKPINELPRISLKNAIGEKFRK